MHAGYRRLGKCCRPDLLDGAVSRTCSFLLLVFLFNVSDAYNKYYFNNQKEINMINKGLTTF